MLCFGVFEFSRNDDYDLKAVRTAESSLQLKVIVALKDKDRRTNESNLLAYQKYISTYASLAGKGTLLYTFNNNQTRSNFAREIKTLLATILTEDEMKGKCTVYYM
jgi:hypothetical protein